MNKRNALVTALIDDSAALLDRVLIEAYANHQDDTDITGTYVYRHARNIQELWQDYTLLFPTGRTGACRIVLRSMFEGLFKLVAAVKVPAFAAEKILAEVDFEISNIKKWSPSLSSEESSMSGIIQELTVFAANFRSTFGVVTNKKWNVYDTAVASGLGSFYLCQYAVLSQSVHSCTSGIIGHENCIGRGTFLSNAIFCVLIAAAHVVQVMNTSDAQYFIDESARLLDIATDFIQAGVFSDDMTIG